MQIITNVIQWVTAHPALITTVVLAFHTIQKGVKDAKVANKDKVGADKTISIVLDTLAYIFSGTRA